MSRKLKLTWVTFHWIVKMLNWISCMYKWVVITVSSSQWILLSVDSKIERISPEGVFPLSGPFGVAKQYSSFSCRQWLGFFPQGHHDFSRTSFYLCHTQLVSAHIDPSVLSSKVVTAGLFKGLYKHHRGGSVVSRFIICHPLEYAQKSSGQPPPL